MTTAEIAWGLFPGPRPEGSTRARCLALEPGADGPGAHVFAVAEGVGGDGAAEAAGRVTLDALTRLSPRLQIERPRLWLRDALAAAARAVREHRGGEPVAPVSTVTALVLGGSQVVIGHVGDCRAYLVRDGELEQCTTDHTRAAELVGLRLLTPEQALTHPARSLLTRGLGTRPVAGPDIVSRPLRAGDTWVLCSAGMSHALDRAGILEVVRRRSPLDAAVSLVDTAGDGAAAVVATVVRPGSAASPERRLWYSSRPGRRSPEDR